MPSDRYEIINGYSLLSNLSCRYTVYLYSLYRQPSQFVIIVRAYWKLKLFNGTDSQLLLISLCKSYNEMV